MLRQSNWGTVAFIILYVRWKDGINDARKMR